MQERGINIGLKSRQLNWRGEKDPDGGTQNNCRREKRSMEKKN